MNSFQNPQQKSGGSIPSEASLTEIYSWLLVMTFLLFLQHIRCWASLWVFPLPHLLGPNPSHGTRQTYYRSENWKMEPCILYLWFEVRSSHELTRTPTPIKNKRQWPPRLQQQGNYRNLILPRIWIKDERKRLKKRKTSSFISPTAYLHFDTFVPCK